MVWKIIALWGVLYLGWMDASWVMNNLSLAIASKSLGAETIQPATDPMMAR